MEYFYPKNLKKKIPLEQISFPPTFTGNFGEIYCNMNPVKTEQIHGIQYFRSQSTPSRYYIQGWSLKGKRSLFPAV